MQPWRHGVGGGGYRVGARITILVSLEEAEAHLPWLPHLPWPASAKPRG